MISKYCGRKQKFSKMSSINIHLTTFYCALSTTELLFRKKIRLRAFFPILYLYIHLCIYKTIKANDETGLWHEIVV